MSRREPTSPDGPITPRVVQRAVVLILLALSVLIGVAAGSLLLVH